MKSFYEFKGSWLQIFDRLVGIISPSNVRKFTIWESKSVSKKHLLIVYQVNLDGEWERLSDINRISESEFVANYKCKINDHVIHGFNEFKKEKRNPLNDFLGKISAFF
jgi:hypothetical protein